MSPQDLGEKLRRCRERRSVSLETIAAATKINRRLFAQLEEGDCSRWPAGIYSRAYVRAYASAVGLDPEEVVAEFADCYPAVAWPEGRPGVEPAEPAPANDFAPRTGRVAGRGFARGTT